MRVLDRLRVIAGEEDEGSEEKEGEAMLHWVNHGARTTRARTSVMLSALYVNADVRGPSLDPASSCYAFPRMLPIRLLHVLCALSLLTLVGCDDPPAQVDAGMSDAGPLDAGPPDAGPPLTCADVTVMEGVLGDTVSVMFDTRMTETRPRDLGLTCGNVEGELRWAPQEVVAFTVPGSGEVAVDLDTVFNGDTDVDFNTVLQVRETCEVAPTEALPPTCFDDAAPTEFRSRGSFLANGGDVVFIVVTGHSNPPATQGTVDSGRVRLDISVRENATPTITEGSLVLALDDAVISVAGVDDDGDARGVLLNFYNSVGQMLDIYGDGQATDLGSAFPIPFDPAPTTPEYGASITVPGAQVNLAGYLRAAAVGGHATFRVYDAAFALSEPLTVEIVEADLVGFGEVCDATHVCYPEMTCIAGTCGATGPVARACDNAIELAVEPGGTLERDGVTGQQYGNFAPQETCVSSPNATIGAEAVYSVTIPAGVTADLLATTAPGPASTDTVLYLRSACPDSGSELACNDDISGSNPRSAIEVEDLGEGTYFIFVERWGGLAEGTIPHKIQVQLRTVLGPGEVCDDPGVLSRCAMGTCTDGLCPEPAP